MKDRESTPESSPLLQRAFDFAAKAHAGQTRADGSAYITHPIAVVKIASEEFGITDPEELAILALHDTVEDAEVTLDDIEKEFGKKVRLGVDGLTKLRTHRETIKKVYDWNLSEPLVGVKKLADRLHNMRTLSFMPEKNRLSTSIQTLNIYSPLAESLGMWTVKRELENLAFPYADPKNYARFSKLFNEDPRVNEPFRTKMKTRLENLMRNAGIAGYVDIRENSLVRLKDKKEDFQNINDVISFRMIPTGKEPAVGDNCYRLLRILKREFKDKEDESRFHDFYHTPRFNQYSAIQVTIDYPDIGPIEIAIASEEKEDYNNWGVLSLIKRGEKNLSEYAMKLVITPSGQAKFLPTEATGLDLAYLLNIRTAPQAVDMIVNGEKCPISMVIPNSADVKINYGPERIAPNRLDVMKSLPSTQKKAEKQFLEQKMFEEEIKGKKIISEIIAKRGLLELHDLTKLDEHAGKLGDFLRAAESKRSESILYRLVGSGVITIEELNSQLDAQGITKKELRITSIRVEGINKVDLSSFFNAEIGNREGDIRYLEGGTRNGKTFSVRFVVENLSSAKEDEIYNVFKKHPLITNVDVV